MDWVIGLAGSFIIAGAAYRKRSLSGSGMLAAIIVGTLLYAIGSLAWFGTLLAFFVSSTFLSRWKKHRKKAAESTYEKSGRRDAGQVFANGGAATLCCLANVVAPSPLWWAAFIGAMAAANADTWATEIGGLSKSAPRSILTGRKVTAGTSGGVTLLGFTATASGGIFIAMMAWVFLQLNPKQIGTSLPMDAETGFWSLFILGLLGGTLGALLDSVIGASWQRMYVCQTCGRLIEQESHCGHKATRVRGWNWMNNDRVNLICTVFGGIVAMLTAGILL